MSKFSAEVIYKERIVATKLGLDVSPEDQMKIAEDIGPVFKPDDDRHSVMRIIPGMQRVTRGALFGTDETLDWHANKPSDPDRAGIVWIYAKEGTKGSRTSWIDNYKAYQDLSDDIKEQIKDITFTCGFKKGLYTPDPFFKEHHNKKLIHNLIHTNKAGLTGMFFPFYQIMAWNGDQELFDILQSHCMQEKYQYHHDWEDGDLVLSDQWLTLHKRWAFDKMDKRVMNRIPID